MKKENSTEWLYSLLSEKFFTPCFLHESSKKNEKNIFCVDCCITICPHCLPSHHHHRLLQVRRYVYHDVIRLDDLEKLIDCGFVQPYTTNSAKVVFLNQRPQSRPFKGSGSICSTCERSLQEPYHFCSLACKVQYHVRCEGCISRYLYDCEYLPLPDSVYAQYEVGFEEGQMTPSSVLDGGISFRTSSGSSANGAVCCRTVWCTATTEFVRKKRSSSNYRNATETPSPLPSVNKRKGVPHRSPFY